MCTRIITLQIKGYLDRGFKEINTRITQDYSLINLEQIAGWGISYIFYDL